MMHDEEDSGVMPVEQGHGGSSSSAPEVDEISQLREKLAAQEVLIRDLLSAQEAQDRGQRHRIDLAAMYAMRSRSAAPEGSNNAVQVGSDDDDEEANPETERLLPPPVAHALPVASAAPALTSAQQSGISAATSLGLPAEFGAFMTESELADAQLALMMQNMELAAAGMSDGAAPRPEQHVLEDPVWGKVEFPPGVRPKPHHVLCFNCCPCLVGDVLSWPQETSENSENSESLSGNPENSDISAENDAEDPEGNFGEAAARQGLQMNRSTSQERQERQQRQQQGRKRLWFVGKVLRRLPKLHPSKAEVLARLRKTWAANLAIAQISVMVVMVLWCGGGLAPREINPMLGPWPTTLVVFGAKNSSLILYENEWWRLLTPALLHAGFIHLAVNLIIQLRLGVFLEYEWGWKPWLIVYVLAAAFSSLMSCIFLPDQLGVGSSGALMGLMGAWFVEIVCKWSSPGLDEDGHEQQKHHFMMCTLNLGVTLGFSFVPYVDWAAHVGGMVAGMALGFVLFAKDLPSESAQKWAPRLASIFLVISTTAALSYFLTRGAPDPQLSDVCSYYENAFPDKGPLPAC